MQKSVGQIIVLYLLWFKEFQKIHLLIELLELMNNHQMAEKWLKHLIVREGFREMNT